MSKNMRNGGFVCGMEVRRTSKTGWSTTISLPKRGVRRDDLKGGSFRDPAIEKKYFNVFAGEVVILRAGCYRATRLVTTAQAAKKGPETKVFTLDSHPDLVVQCMSEMDVFREALFWSCNANEKLDSDYMVDYSNICSRDYFDRYDERSRQPTKKA